MTQEFCFAPPETASVAIAGAQARFPVHRIYCIGRNYAEHAKEMGAAVTPDDPIFFMKPADALVGDGRDIAYPSATADLHHELELVVALKQGGKDLTEADARRAIFGYALGLDLTRRDLQAKAKAKQAPWDVAKGFDASAPIGDLHRIEETGELVSGRISLTVNEVLRQQADISEMVLPPVAIIMALSKLFELRAGDLIFTGTPQGVAALNRGDRVLAEFPGLSPLRARIV